MKKIQLDTIIRQDIAEMDEYFPVASLWDLRAKFKQRLEDVVKLDAGENQFGYSPKVLTALNTQGLFNFYPDPEYKELRQALANYSGAKLDNIMVGSGSDEMLDLLLRLILDEGDQIVNCPPTFGMYPILTKLNRGQLLTIPRTKDFAIDVEKIKKSLNQKVKAIIICSPNNPTGTITSRGNIISLLNTGKLVIVDEAYYEFSGKTVAPLVARYENLIVLRTLSKWAGLAGLRIGYGIMNPFLVRQLLKVKPPYNVNLAANIAGIASLNDVAWQREKIQAIVSERKRVAIELGKLTTLTIYPSAANSIFIKFSKGFTQLRDFLEKKKITVRYYDEYQAIRLSVGTPKQNNQVIAVLNKFMQPQWDSIIFDLDGVLIDVSLSYREAIKRTVSYVLQTQFKLQLNVSPNDIEMMKKIPGFNNDWDLSFALIKLLSTGVKRNNFKQNISALSKKTKISREYLQIKDIFQAYYLGEKLFSQIYKRQAPVAGNPGLIVKESLLFDLAAIRELSKKYKLAVATSRPRFEAIYSLKELGIFPLYFSQANIVALEDCLREKPFPDPLLKAQKLIGTRTPIYIGDSINDLLAAKAAQMPCIFIGKNDAAEFSVAKPNQIEEILL